MAISTSRTRQEIVDNVGAGGTPIEVLDEGISLTTAVTSINFTGIGVTTTEPTPNNLEVSVAGNPLIVQDTGVNLTSAAKKLNFSGFTITEPIADEITVTASGGGHTIQDEGVAVAQRNTINFTGAGVTVTDVGLKTVVNIPGGGGSSGGSLIAFETTLTAPINEITITGLTYGKAYNYTIYSDYSSTASGILEINGDTNSTNYKSRYLFASLAAGPVEQVVTGQSVAPGLTLSSGTPGGSTLSQGILYLNSATGIEKKYSNGVLANTTWSSEYSSAISNYTSLKLKTDSGTFGIGSKVVFYEVGAGGQSMTTSSLPGYKDLLLLAKPEDLVGDTNLISWENSKHSRYSALTTAGGKPQIVIGYKGRKAIDLSSSTSQLSWGNFLPELWFANQSATIALLINPTSLGNNIITRNSSGVSGWLIGDTSTIFRNTTANNTLAVDYSLVMNQWNTLIVKTDFSQVLPANRLKIWVNGTLQTNYSATGTGECTDSINSLKVSNDTGTSYPGLLAWLGIWKTGVTDSEAILLHDYLFDFTDLN
jgi:hypothetical protein